MALVTVQALEASTDRKRLLWERSQRTTWFHSLQTDFTHIGDKTVLLLQIPESRILYFRLEELAN